MNNYPLTRDDFDAATRVLQRLIEFRDAEDGRNGRTSYLNDRSSHLRESVKSLALACDFWAAPAPAESRPPARRRSRPRNRTTPKTAGTAHRQENS